MDICPSVQVLIQYTDMFSFCISEKHQVRGLGAGLQDPQQLVLTCLAWAEDLFSGQRGGSPVCDSFQGEANGFI